jgi:hypothetical protein
LPAGSNQRTVQVSVAAVVMVSYCEAVPHTQGLAAWNTRAKLPRFMHVEGHTLRVAWRSRGRRLMVG